VICDDIWLWSVTIFMWCWFKFEFKSYLNKKFGPIADVDQIHVDQIHDVLDHHNTLLLCFQTMQSMTKINMNPWRLNSVQQIYDVRYMTNFSYVMDSWLWRIFGNLWPNPSSCKAPILVVFNILLLLMKYVSLWHAREKRLYRVLKCTYVYIHIDILTVITYICM